MKRRLMLAAALATRKTTGQALVEDALVRIATASGEGARVLLRNSPRIGAAPVRPAPDLGAAGRDCRYDP